MIPKYEQNIGITKADIQRNIVWKPKKVESATLKENSKWKIVIKCETIEDIKKNREELDY